MIFYAHECEENIGYAFADKILLRKCFTHTSYANEHGDESNEKLEYLGDSILNFVVAEYLFLSSEGNEGQLSRRRAEIVSAPPLSEAVRGMGVDKFLLVGEGEKNKPANANMCADLFEAIVAGIYIDGGFETAKKFIYSKLLTPANGKRGATPNDYKSMFQELVQGRKSGKIEYVLISKEGPDHSPEFTCGVRLGGNLIATGVGRSKKTAEQKAAEIAYQKFSKKRGK